jgi:hypothetical protein
VNAVVGNRPFFGREPLDHGEIREAIAVEVRQREIGASPLFS